MILRSCFVGGGEKEALRVGAHYGGERQEDEGGAEKTRMLHFLFSQAWLMAHLQKKDL